MKKRGNVRPLVKVLVGTGLFVGCSLSSVGSEKPDAVGDDDNPGGLGGESSSEGGTRASGGSGTSEGGGSGQAGGGESGSDGGLGGSSANGGTTGGSPDGSGGGDAGAAGAPSDCIELGNCENPPPRPIVVAGNTTCFIASDERVRCWGGEESSPTTAEPPGGPITQLSGGGGALCGLGASSTIACWGFSGNPPGSGFVEVAAYSSYTLGLRADGSVQGYGDGVGPQVLGWQGPIDGTARFKKILAGYETLCGLHANGAATCWRSPHVSLGVGGNHACRANVDGTLQCWGDDALGQASPPDAGNFVEVSAGAEHTCALKTTGEVSCWGANTHGQSTPTPGSYVYLSSGKDFSCGYDFSSSTFKCWGNVPPSAALTSQFAAGDAHVCQLSTPVTCFGDNSQGQSSPPPNMRMVAIAAGSAHTCGILNGVSGSTPPGKILCWGDNSDARSTPPDGTFIDIAAGEAHTCALSPTGVVTCWGKNDRGQTRAPSGQFVALGASGSLSCGVSVTGNTVCWGDSSFGRLAPPPPPTFKELSLGGLTNEGRTAIVCGIRSDDTRFCSTATRTLATLPATDLHGFSIGDHYGEPVICALRPDKTAVCWGDAPTGIFVTDPEALLQPPPGPFDFVAVGSWHACGVRPNRTVACWGNNFYNQTDVPSEIAGP